MLVEGSAIVVVTLLCFHFAKSRQYHTPTYHCIIYISSIIIIIYLFNTPFVVQMPKVEN